MFTAEIVVIFLLLLPLGRWLGLRHEDMVALPPLNLLTALGARGLAEFLGLWMLFFAYQVVLFALLVAIGWLRGEEGLARVRRRLAEGRDATGLRPLLWVTLVGASLVAALLLPQVRAELLGTAHHLDRSPTLPLLFFVTMAIVLTAAQTLRPFTSEQLWRGIAALGASMRDLTRPPGPNPPATVGEPEPPSTPPVGQAVRAGQGWLELMPGPGRLAEGGDADLAR